MDKYYSLGAGFSLNKVVNKYGYRTARNHGRNYKKAKDS